MSGVAWALIGVGALAGVTPPLPNGERRKKAGSGPSPLIAFGRRLLRLRADGGRNAIELRAWVGLVSQFGGAHCDTLNIRHVQWSDVVQVCYSH